MLETRIRQHARTVDRNTAGRVPRWIGPILFLGFCCPAALRAELILDLNDRARIALTPHQQGVAIFEMAYVHAAIYDAVNAIDGRYTFFAVTPSSVPEGSSKEAAAIAAAYVVLIARVPANAAALAAERDGLLSAIPDGPGKTNGIAIGVEVGQGILDFRKDDGLDAAPPPYAFGSGPAEYQQIPIFQPRVDPINQNFATMRPFALLSPSQFRAPGPSDLKSKRWADDYNEVRARGAKSSTVRTPEETNLGISYTENGMVYYTRIYHNVSVAYDLGLEDNARFFAMLYLSQADSFIAVFGTGIP